MSEVFFYVQHLLGIGHLKRAATLDGVSPGGVPEERATKGSFLCKSASWWSIKPCDKRYDDIASRGVGR